MNLVAPPSLPGAESKGCRRYSSELWFILGILPRAGEGAKSEPISSGSLVGVLRRYSIRDRGLDAGSRNNLSGLAVANDRTVPGWADPRGGWRSQPAECFLRR